MESGLLGTEAEEGGQLAQKSRPEMTLARKRCPDSCGQVSTAFSQAWPPKELTRKWTHPPGEPLLGEGKLSGDSPPKEVN